MLRPTYKIEAGKLELSPKPSDHIIEIVVRLSLDSAPGSFEAKVKIDDIGITSVKDTKLSPDNKDASNNKVSVSMGYRDENGNNDDLSLVFLGNVTSVNTSRENLMVLSPLTNLYKTRIDRPYNHQTAGAILKDLAKEAKIDVEISSDGIAFPSYVVSRHKTLYQHMVELAHICDFDFYGTNESKIVFTARQEKNSHHLKHGVNIIEITHSNYKPHFSSVKVAGASAADAKGADKHYWQSKTSIIGLAGDHSSGDEYFIQDSSIKDKKTATHVAEGILKKLKTTTSINVKIIGNPKIMLGDSVEIEDVGVQDGESMDGKYQVREIEHFMSRSRGFTTSLVCWRNPTS